MIHHYRGTNSSDNDYEIPVKNTRDTLFDDNYYISLIHMAFLALIILNWLYFKFILCFLLLFKWTSSRLLNVVQLNRHGARTSTNFRNGLLSKYFGSDMKLTPNGYRQHQILGQYIHDKYINRLHFLSETYQKNQFEIFSTQTQRTIFSAEGFLSGLYPGSVVKVSYDNKALDIITNDTIPFLLNYKPLFNFQQTEIELKVIDLKNDIMFHPMGCKLN